MEWVFTFYTPEGAAQLHDALEWFDGNGLVVNVTTLDGAFTQPIASATLSGPLEKKAIELVTEFNTGEVDGPRRAGFHKALPIDFNYDAEPLPGHYPTAMSLPLLKESRPYHLGKLMFQSFYWHSLLPGRDIPGVGSAMPGRGKRWEPSRLCPPSKGVDHANYRRLRR